MPVPQPQYTQRGDRRYLVRAVGKFERVNAEECRMVSSGDLGRLTPVYMSSLSRKTELYADVTSLYPLSAYMRQAVNAQTAVKWLWDTAQIAHMCECNGLQIERLCWDPSCMYVDAHGHVVMVYWPVTTLEPPRFSAFRFYYEFCHVLAHSRLSVRLYRRYYEFFSHRNTMDFAEFYNLVQRLYKEFTERCSEQEHLKKADVQEVIDHRVGKRESASACLKNRKTGDVLYLKSETVVFGRDAGYCTVDCSACQGVSRRHAAVYKKGDRYYVTDLGSSNGTFVDNTRVPPNRGTALYHGAVLRIGPLSWTFHDISDSRTLSIHQPKRR